MVSERGSGETSCGDDSVERGARGETYQVAGDGRPSLTTKQGVIVGDDQNTLRVGERGPALFEDFHFRLRFWDREATFALGGE